MHLTYCTVEEIAKKWGISARSVRNYCTEGRIADAVLDGKIWRIPREAVKPVRKPRFDQMPKTIAGVLKMEMEAHLKGRLYHQLQIDFTFNSNHIEGSRLTHEQTRWIFETQTIGSLPDSVPVDDIVETSNHFRCIDKVISSCGAALTERYIKDLHALLKNGTSDSRKPWFAVGAYKRLNNVVGEMETCPVERVRAEMARLVADYAASQKTIDDIIDFHVRFESIHPFQDGNGRVGRLILLKECLKNGHTPFIVTDDIKRFYYLGLEEWRQGRRERLHDVFGTGQDMFRLGLAHFGYGRLAQNREL